MNRRDFLISVAAAALVRPPFPVARGEQLPMVPVRRPTCLPMGGGRGSQIIHAQIRAYREQEKRRYG